MSWPTRGAGFRICLTVILQKRIPILRKRVEELLFPAFTLLSDNPAYAVTVAVSISSAQLVPAGGRR